MELSSCAAHKHAYIRGGNHQVCHKLSKIITYWIKIRGKAKFFPPTIPFCVIAEHNHRLHFTLCNGTPCKTTTTRPLAH